MRVEDAKVDDLSSRAPRGWRIYPAGAVWDALRRQLADWLLDLSDFLSEFALCVDKLGLCVEPGTEPPEESPPGFPKNAHRRPDGLWEAEDTPPSEIRRRRPPPFETEVGR